MKKLLKSLTFNPRQIFRHNKTSRSVSKSSPLTSFSSTSSLDSSHKPPRAASLPPRSPSDSDWSNSSFADAFKLIDRDGDGKIERVELESLLRRVGGKTAPIPDEEIAGMIGEIDRDGDGCVTLEELEAVGSMLLEGSSSEEDLKEAFEFFDADHDGKITAEELQSVFVALGDDRCTLEDCRRMIETVDVNKDGFVCFQDFARMMDLNSSTMMIR